MQLQFDRGPKLDESEDYTDYDSLEDSDPDTQITPGDAILTDGSDNMNRCQFNHGETSRYGGDEF